MCKRHLVVLRLPVRNIVLINRVLCTVLVSVLFANMMVVEIWRHLVAQLALVTIIAAAIVALYTDIEPHAQLPLYARAGGRVALIVLNGLVQQGIVPLTA